MARQLRDIVMSLTALLLLGLMLISINPRLRERASEFGGAGGSQQMDAARGVIGHAMEKTLGLTSGYAADNTYLFVFLVVACVLFVLMLRT
jgi:hypothetical protein